MVPLRPGRFPGPGSSHTSPRSCLKAGPSQGQSPGACRRVPPSPSAIDGPEAIPQGRGSANRASPPQHPTLMSASFERFIGVDLGGGKGKKTALAVLERRDDGVAVVSLLPRSGDAPLYDGALVAAIRSRAAG